MEGSHNQLFGGVVQYGDCQSGHHRLVNMHDIELLLLQHLLYAVGE
jgi:hypothetical protein